MFYQADWILPSDAPSLRGGWIRVEADRITGIGTAAELPSNADAQKFPGCALLPGLINAHCHLELTSLKDRLPSGKSFPVWVEELRGFTAGLDASDYHASALKGVDLLLSGGATTVVDVGNTGDALPVLAASPLRAFGFMETLGLDPSVAGFRFTHAKAQAGHTRDTSCFHSGIAPHAAYSCSPELLSAVIRHQQTSGLPVTIHASESREEADLFASASGPLQEYCRRIFAGASEHRNTTPIRWLESEGLFPDHALIVHGNHLDDADMEILLRHKSTMVHCPSSHAFFGHKKFPYRELKARGIPVCLGTDSLASGDSLSMLDQIRLFRKGFPEVAAQEALHLATVVAAEAIGMGNELGKLKAGYKADFIVVRTKTSPKEDPCEAVLRQDAEVVFAAVDGRDAGLK